MSLAILDAEWNKAIDAAAEELKKYALAMRSANGEGDAWVWPCANAFDRAAESVLKLKRTTERITT